MANSRNLPAVSDFAKEFAVGLREVMKARGVTQTPVAEAIGRDQTYVSERVRGVRAPDTDVIAGVAEVAGVTPATIVKEVMAAVRAAKAVEATPVVRNLPTLADNRRQKSYPVIADEAAREDED